MSITIVFILATLMTVIYDNIDQKIWSGNTLLGES